LISTSSNISGTKVLMFSKKPLNIIKFNYSPKFCRLLLVAVLFLCVLPLLAQEPAAPAIKPTPDSLTKADTLKQATDSVTIDSAAIGKITQHKPLLESEVKYTAEDSLIFSIGKEKVYLYDKGTVQYQDIGLKGDYIEFDYNSKVAMAAGAPDSTGILTKPEFTQGNDKFDFDTMHYNFETRKAKIIDVVTQQGEGFLHSTETKRQDNGEIHIKKGKYTTCDAPHPHFYIALTKAISVPGKRTVSGPAYLVFEDIPMPLGLPFGFFPNTNKRSSGFIIPEFRDEKRRGFGLENGGWYFAMNDYLDVTLMGSVYSRGTWGIKALSQYTVKYKYSGSFTAQFFKNQINDDPTFTTSKDFKINWSHRQDTKANPTRSFSASVDFSTSSFEKQQGSNFANILENQKNSSIAYSKKWPGRPFNFTANLSGNQSTQTRKVNMTLPTMTFNMEGIYPFRGKDDDGDYNWLENIKVSYSSKLENKIVDVYDSLLFTQSTLKNMKNGFTHSIPISLDNITLFKFINITPSLSYNGVVYPYYIRKTARSDTSVFMKNSYEVDTIRKVTYAQGFSTALSISINPKIYGDFVSTRPNSYIIAVRHVMSPKISASFSPDMKGLVPDYYRNMASSSSAIQPMSYSEYSVYEGQIYSTPTVSGKSGSVSLGLGNNLEMKVRSKSDTTGEGKKVSILDNLDFSTSYQPFAETNKWSPLSMSGRSTLFKNNLQLTFGSVFNPYALDSAGTVTDKFLFSEKGKLFRLTSARINVTFRLQSASGKKKESSGESVDEKDVYSEKTRDIDEYDAVGGSVAGDYVDFDIPWSLSINYSWSYSKPAYESSLTHSVSLSGDISLTPKWKIGANTSYDFVAGEFSATNISIHRDLHCWEMSFGVVPFGTYRNYSFTIRAKSSILHDLKWDKRKTWYDNF
jgi:lipopolysaccharide assembly outer membrane protein LptD (OstA)